MRAVGVLEKTLAALDEKDAVIASQAAALASAHDKLAAQATEMHELKRRTIAAFGHLRLVAEARRVSNIYPDKMGAVAPTQSRTQNAGGRNVFPTSIQAAPSGANSVTLSWMWPTGSSLFEVLAADVETGECFRDLATASGPDGEVVVRDEIIAPGRKLAFMMRRRRTVVFERAKCANATSALDLDRCERTERGSYLDITEAMLPPAPTCVRSRRVGTHAVLVEWSLIAQRGAARLAPRERARADVHVRAREDFHHRFPEAVAVVRAFDAAALAAARAARASDPEPLAQRECSPHDEHGVLDHPALVAPPGGAGVVFDVEMIVPGLLRVPRKVRAEWVRAKLALLLVRLRRLAVAAAPNSSWRLMFGARSTLATSIGLRLATFLRAPSDAFRRSAPSAALTLPPIRALRLRSSIDPHAASAAAAATGTGTGTGAVAIGGRGALSTHGGYYRSSYLMGTYVVDEVLTAQCRAAAMAQTTRWDEAKFDAIRARAAITGAPYSVELEHEACGANCDVYKHVGAGSLIDGRPHWLFRGPDGGWFVGERAHVGTNEGLITSDFRATHPLAVTQWLFADSDAGWTTDHCIGVEVADAHDARAASVEGHAEVLAEQDELNALVGVVVTAGLFPLTPPHAGEARAESEDDAGAENLMALGPGFEQCNALLGTYVVDETLPIVNGAPVFKQLLGAETLNECAYLSRGGSAGGTRAWGIGDREFIGRSGHAYIVSEGPALSPVRAGLKWRAWWEESTVSAAADARSAGYGCGAIARFRDSSVTVAAATDPAALAARVDSLRERMARAEHIVAVRLASGGFGAEHHI